MPRINPLSLKRPGDIEETETFTDPAHPGAEFVFTLRATPDFGSESLRQEQERDLVYRYVTGDFDFVRSDGAEGTRPASLSLPGGPPVVITEYLCRAVAALMQMEKAAWQKAKDEGAPWEDAPYNETDWFALSDRAPSAFIGVLGWANGLLNRSRSATEPGN